MPSLTSLRFYKKAKPTVVVRVSERQLSCCGFKEVMDRLDWFCWIETSVSKKSELLSSLESFLNNFIAFKLVELKECSAC